MRRFTAVCRGGSHDGLRLGSHVGRRVAVADGDETVCECHGERYVLKRRNYQWVWVAKDLIEEMMTDG